MEIFTKYWYGTQILSEMAKRDYHLSAYRFWNLLEPLSKFEFPINVLFLTNLKYISQLWISFLDWRCSSSFQRFNINETIKQYLKNTTTNKDVIWKKSPILHVNKKWKNQTHIASLGNVTMYHSTCKILLWHIKLYHPRYGCKF